MSLIAHDRYTPTIHTSEQTDCPFPHEAHECWWREHSFVWAGGLMYSRCHDVFETGTTELDQDGFFMIWRKCRNGYDASRINLQRYEREGEPSLNRIITQDEIWVKSYEPQLKRLSNEWLRYGSRRSKVRQISSNVKVMVILVYDCEVILTP
mgnify:CR=1 FL=1